VIFQRINASRISSITCVTHRTNILRTLINCQLSNESRNGLPLPPEVGSPRPLISMEQLIV
jgi:hypothetical protein